MKHLKINPQVYNDLAGIKEYIEGDNVTVTAVVHGVRDFSALKF